MEDISPIKLKLPNLKRCPFCGAEAELHIDPLQNGSHGYHDCYQYFVQCPKCRTLRPDGSSNTIYHTADEALQYAVDKWNQRYVQAHVYVGGNKLEGDIVK